MFKGDAQGFHGIRNGVAQNDGGATFCGFKQGHIGLGEVHILQIPIATEGIVHSEVHLDARQIQLLHHIVLTAKILHGQHVACGIQHAPCPFYFMDVCRFGGIEQVLI